MSNNTKNKGFTLIELVIAIFILVVAIIGVYNSYSTVIVLTAGASSRFTGAYLAQEGIEIVRNMRDNNWLKRQNWMNGLVPRCLNGCEADYKTGTSPELHLTPWPSDGNYLKIKGTNFYSYDDIGDDVSPTKFKRKIKIRPQDHLGSNQGTTVLKVFVLVTWEDKEEKCTISGDDCDSSCPFCIKAEEYLYNWY